MSSPWQSPPFTVVADLRADGLTDSEIHHRVAGLRRWRRGVYGPPPPTDREERHRWEAAAVVASHHDVVLSHVAAAIMWDLPVLLPELGRVAVSRIGGFSTGHSRHEGVRVFGNELSERDVTVRGGLPVTTAERTVLDCGRQLPFKVAVAIADAAAHDDRLDDRTLRRMLSEMKGWTGVGKARRMLAATDARAESPGESWTRLVLAQRGVSVTSQFEVWNCGDFVGRADFLVTGTRILVEFDGQTKYGLSDDSPREVLWREKRRHDALVAAGYEVVRLTWEDLVDPPRMLRLIAEARERTQLRNLAPAAPRDHSLDRQQRPDAEPQI